MENKIQRIETLGSTYVKIEQFSGARKSNNFNYTVKYVHRKVGGLILRQRELVTQDSTSYELQSEKIETQSRKAEFCVRCSQAKDRVFVQDRNERERNETEAGNCAAVHD